MARRDAGHPDVANTKDKLASVYDKQGKYKYAEQLRREVLNTAAFDQNGNYLLNN